MIRCMNRPVPAQIFSYTDRPAIGTLIYRNGSGYPAYLPSANRHSIPPPHTRWCYPGHVSKPSNFFHDPHSTSNWKTADPFYPDPAWA